MHNRDLAAIPLHHKLIGAARDPRTLLPFSVRAEAISLSRLPRGEHS